MDAYWAACARGELVIQRCTACERRVHLPAVECPWCGGADLPFEPVSGEGVVHTFTVVHRSFVKEFSGRGPYVLAWVDLPEGARALGQVVDCPPERVRIGMQVRVTFRDELPQWRPG
ncbi:Zn-ribbon domain-containing OB-fold protein [Nonomuraea africana]|uniref:Zn-ribbon domain-containing OB-fold protein n=1 Tax=Nonomuraea africana TaxID=46171 RepID=UPI0033D69EE6